MKKLFFQKGIGLIEVLVAAAVFAVGITAVVQLQGTFFKNSSAANARSIAMSIAQEKIEDLRGFQVTDSSVIDIFDFTSITANGGGRCTEQLIDGVCTLALPSGSVARDNITFNRNWSVNNYYYNGGALSTTANGDIAQKQVAVTVTWTDIDGSTQTATLSTVINQFSGAASTGLLANNIGGSGEKPVVNYTASSDTGVVAVSVGVNVNRETLVPTTNASNQVKFTAYTYGSGGNLLRQEDFLTVSCECEFTTAGSARTPGYAKWDSSINSYKDYDGDLISKDDKGQRSGGGQDDMCDICCQDHHDTGASAVDSQSQNYCDPASNKLDRCYDPFRGSSDYVSGKHNHYTSAGTVASSGAYLEACRMKRINGYWRVYQDWHRVDLSAFPISEITATNVNNHEAAYVGYVKGVVDKILEDNAITRFNGQTFTKPIKPTSINRDSSNKILLWFINQTETLTGRAVFVDYLSTDLLSKIKAKKVALQEYLVDVPFYEVEVTNRAPRCASTSTAYGGWCPPANNTVLVGAGGITDKKGNGLAVGEIQAIATTSGSNVTFEMRRSNSGLMGLTSPVDVHASALNRDIERDAVTATVKVFWGGGITTHTLSVTLSGGTPISGTLVVTPISDTGTCIVSGTSYSCTVPDGVSGSLTFTGATATDICSGTSTYPTSLSNQSITMTITCAPTSTTHTLLVTLSGGTPVTGTLTVIPASGTGNCTGSAASYSCTVPNSETGSLSFTGLTSAGASCSGTGSYTSSAQSTAMTITCQTMRSLTTCVTSGAGTEVKSGGTLTTSTVGSCGQAGTCGSGKKGLQFSCSVPNGLNGTLSFVGLRKDGGGTANCTGSATFNATDATVNLTCIDF